MKMKAAVLRECGAPAPFAESRPIQIEEVELDPPQATEVLVRIGGAGLCHSDLSVINGTRARPLPLVLGHEGAGEVMEVGSAVTDLKPGDHVVFQFSPSCGRCRRCQEGRPSVCEAGARSKASGELMGGGKRLHLDGKDLAHHSGVSCFAEYAVADRGSVVKVDHSLPLDEAALFGCAVMTGVGAVINTGRIRPGDTVAVIGLGGVGLNGLLGAKLAGAETIVAIDLSDAKLGLARQLGATHTVNASNMEACIAEVRDITHGGVDFAFELAGSIPAMQTAYGVTRYGGTTVTAGLSPLTAEFSFNHSNLVSEEKAIRGSYMGSCVPVRDIPRFVSLYQQGRLPIDKLISERVTLNEINEGFDRLAAGATVRQILVPLV